MPPTSGRNRRTPQVVVERRVAIVAALLATGARRELIQQAVAKAQNDERAARAQITRDNAVTAAMHARDDRAPQQPLPPMVWGDEPIAERTVDRYIHDAKDLLAEDAIEAASDRARLLGRMLARGEQLYAASFRAGKYHAAHQVWRTTIQLFGLEEVARLMLPPEDAAGDGRPMVDVVTDGPALPSESRRKLLEQVASGVQAEVKK